MLSFPSISYGLIDVTLDAILRFRCWTWFSQSPEWNLVWDDFDNFFMPQIKHSVSFLQQHWPLKQIYVVAFMRVKMIARKSCLLFAFAPDWFRRKWQSTNKFLHSTDNWSIINELYRCWSQRLHVHQCMPPLMPPRNMQTICIFFDGGTSVKRIGQRKHIVSCWVVGMSEDGPEIYSMFAGTENALILLSFY